MPRATVCSEFFCDPKLWVRLEGEILPGLLRGDRPFRALCVGSGPGYEAYGLLTLLEDFAPGGDWAISAFDVSAEAIAMARAGGPYSDRDLRYVEPSERPRFFVEADGSYLVRPELRKISFSVKDLREVALGSDLSLILYRNIEPFFTPDENQACLARFYDALSPGGVVFLSSVDRCPQAEALGFERPGRGFLRRPEHSYARAAE